jgi:hypothetical protein
MNKLASLAFPEDQEQQTLVVLRCLRQKFTRFKLFILLVYNIMWGSCMRWTTPSPRTGGHHVVHYDVEDGCFD